VIFAIATLFSTAPRAHSQSAQPTEYQLKAAFLFNFAKFIDWPNRSFADSQSPFLICIIGRDPFGNVLDTYLSGKTVDDRTVEIDRFPSPGAPVLARRCQIVFISSSEQQRFHGVIDSFQGQSVLLVGDADGFATSGGTIEFVLEERRIHFAINSDAADRADLKVSSKLLSLAEIVHDAPGKGELK
jgi:hypothetical protein